MTLSKINVVCPRKIVSEAWLKLSDSAGWTSEKSEEFRIEFFKLTAERASKKKPGVKFPANFVFTRSYKTHVGRFLVVAHYSPTYNEDGSVTLTLTQLGAYLKIWESDKLQTSSLECDIFTN